MSVDFEKLPRLMIINESEYKQTAFENCNILRISKNMDIMENQSIDEKTVRKTLLSKTNLINRTELDRIFLTLKPKLETPFSNLLYQIMRMNKLNDFQRFLDEKKFEYQIFLPNMISNSLFHLSYMHKNSKKQKFDLEFEDKLQLIVLLWCFSLDNNWENSKNKLIVIDKPFCFLNDSKIELLIFDFLYKKLFSQLEIKMILTKHTDGDVFNLKEDLFFKFEENEFKPIKTVGTSKNKINCTHGYIESFDDTRLIYYNKKFSQLEKISEWKDIPMFSAIIGLNGIGKTSLLRYFNQIYSNSAIISDLLGSEASEEFNKYLQKLTESYQQIKSLNPKSEASSLKELIKENPIPLLCKCSPRYLLPILLAISNNKAELINKHLKERKYKWQIVENIHEYINKTDLEFLKLNGNQQLNLSVSELNEKIIGKYLIGNYAVTSINEIGFKNGENVIPYESLSSGEKLLLSIYLWEYDIIYNQEEQSLLKNMVLLIDEPDSHLHPSKLKDLIDILKKDFVEKKKMQVIMTTHNPSTLSLLENRDIFVMYEDQNDDKIRIVNNADSPIKAFQLLSAGVWKEYIQQLVIVETEIEELYYTEINRQLHNLSSSNIEKLQLFPTSLRFIGVSKDYLKTDKNQDKIEQLDKLVDELINSIKKQVNKYSNELVKIFESYEILETEILKSLEKNNKKVDRKLNELRNKLSDLKTIPNDYLNNKELTTTDTWIRDMVSELKESYEKRNDYFPESRRDAVKLFVTKSNYLFGSSEQNRRNHTFGIINKREPGVPSDFCPYIIFTDRYDINNYIFDPLNLYFVLIKENFSNKRAKKIEQCIKQSIKKNHNCKKNEINLYYELVSKWNINIIDILDNKSEHKKVLCENLEIILNVMQDTLIEIINEDKEKKHEQQYSKDDLETVKVKFLKPNLELVYHKYILEEPINFDFISRIFCECEDKCKKDCKFKIHFKELSDDQTEVFSPKKFLDYLIKNNFNFLVSQNFVDKFKHLSKIINGEVENKWIRTNSLI